MSKSVELIFLKASTERKRGNIAEARRLYQTILARFPANKRAVQAMGELAGSEEPRATTSVSLAEGQLQALYVLHAQGKLDALLEQASSLARSHPDSPVLMNIVGAAYAGLNRHDEAAAAFSRAIAVAPDYADAHNNLANILADQGKAEEAIASYRRAVDLRPDYADALKNLAGTLKKLGRLGEAAASYRRLIDLWPDQAEPHNLLGTVLMDQGKFGDAERCYRQALLLKPDFAAAHSNLGAVQLSQGRADEAQASFEQAIRYRPDFGAAHNNLGSILKDKGRTEAARAAIERALALNPRLAEAHNNLATLLLAENRIQQAAAALERAIEINPDFPEAHSNMGNALAAMGRREEAETSYRRSLELRPDFAEAHFNLGNLLMEQGELEAAIASYERTLAIKPDRHRALAQKLHLQAEIGDWSAFSQFERTGRQLGLTASISPFTVLAFDDDPARNRTRSRRYVEDMFAQPEVAPFTPPAARPAKIKVGYFSADFHDHATMYLMAGLFREHDRQRFEIHAYGYGTNRSGTMRERLAGDVDSFTDISDMADASVAALARRHGLDIAVDLKGHTQHSRSRLFALRLAPIQINYLGYPGTIGAGFIDYILADDTVIPPGDEAHYCEKVITLPHSYQVNDDRRDISGRVTTRADHGLPYGGFVFCCFNNSYKITPVEFDIWMRLLGKVEGSVLWLLRANRWVEANLRREAGARGVDPDRLVFAGRLPQAEHLARQRHADLFLDTFNVNAHTTASDALWAGLPVLTKLGNGFAARVGGSLLHAVGLPELVTTDQAQYEQLALTLATDPPRLAAIKAKLAENRSKVPLFATAQTTRHIEAAYEDAYRRYLEGRPAASFAIS